MIILVLAACSNPEEYQSETGDPSAVIDNDISESGLSNVGLAISTQENVKKCEGPFRQNRDPFLKGRVQYTTNQNRKRTVYDFCNNSLLTEVFCINNKKVGYEKDIVCPNRSSCSGVGVCVRLPLPPQNDTPPAFNDTPQNDTPIVNNTPVNDTPPSGGNTPIVNDTPGNNTPPSGGNTPIVNDTPGNNTPGNSS
ncbi:hypothetical protein HYV84_05120 [Candidatus Woesearchaeota archaeon]|nr:hypothetical protein [Candidatus Woesearchaeota archaeon]